MKGSPVRGPDEARELLADLANDRRVKGLTVFGSVARSEAGPRSDLDVLIVHAGPAPEDLIDRLPETVSITFYTPPRLAALSQRSPMFALHLAREGLVLHDPSQSMSRSLREIGALDRDAGRRLAASTVRRFRELLGQPRGLELHPHSSAAELYALAKQGAMLLVAANGVPEFNRHRALAAAYEEAALGSIERSRIDALEEPWQAARDRHQWIGWPGDLDAAAAAVRRLLSKLTK